MGPPAPRPANNCNSELLLRREFFSSAAPAAGRAGAGAAAAASRAAAVAPDHAASILFLAGFASDFFIVFVTASTSNQAKAG